MPAPFPDNIVLEHANALFIQGRVAINLGNRDASNRPSLVRAYGCRVAEDRMWVTAFVPLHGAQAFFANLERDGSVAMVISRPSTHETLQLKGHDGLRVELEDHDLQHVSEYCAGFVAEVQGLGYTETFARGLLAAARGAMAGVRFTPAAAFAQTPGPGAGKPLPAVS